MTLHVELVAADRTVWSGEASQVVARTADGDLGVLTGHAPLLSLLIPGVVEITESEGSTLLAAVEEGFLAVDDDRVSILAEDAFLADEIDPSAARSELERLTGEDDEMARRRAEAKVRAVEKST